MVHPKNDSNTDVTITFEDQTNINQFSKLNACLHELEYEIMTIENKMKNLDDAYAETMILDDDDIISYAVGDCFVKIKVSQSTKLIGNEKLLLETTLKDYGERKVSIKSTLSSLKSILYGRLGQNINLEE